MKIVILIVIMAKSKNCLRAHCEFMGSWCIHLECIADWASLLRTLLHLSNPTATSEPIVCLQCSVVTVTTTITV